MRSVTIKAASAVAISALISVIVISTERRLKRSVISPANGDVTMDAPEESGAVPAASAGTEDAETVAEVAAEQSATADAPEPAVEPEVAAEPETAVAPEAVAEAETVEAEAPAAVKA